MKPETFQATACPSHSSAMAREHKYLHDSLDAAATQPTTGAEKL